MCGHINLLCFGFRSAHGCKAVSHCISMDWEHRTVESDPDDICTICKNMVVEARDQLESNLTMVSQHSRTCLINMFSINNNMNNMIVFLLW